jgi:predicted permease
MTMDAGKLRARRALITGQLALALVLVFTASLLIRSFVAAGRVELGFEPEGLLMTNLSVQESTERVGFYRDVVESVGAVPGVEAAGVIEDLFIGGPPNVAISFEGRAQPVRTEVRVDAISGGLFEAVGSPLRAGRTFTTSDGSDAPTVAIVNETMAARFWPGEPAVGRRFRVGPDAPWREIVGVVADMRRQGPERAPIAQVFVPFAQAPLDIRNMNLLVRSGVPSDVLLASIRERVAEVNPSVPLYGIDTVVGGMDRYVAGRRLQTFLLGLFSSLALVLATLGIYGLVRYSVSRRTREIGVRVALGAYAGEVQRMIVREGLLLALPGLIIGAVASVWIGGAFSELLFEVSPSDPFSVAATASALLLATLLAAYLPARRAARVDPIRALRGD